MAEGWIKLHRSCLEHWLYNEYRPLTKREAWETILFTVNYETKKALINGQIIECKRGESLLSLDSWAQKFVWSIGQVRNFFKLLQNDNMIIIEGLKYTTKLTVCNYDKYQDKQQTDNKLATFSEHSEDILKTTTKEVKEYKEVEEIKEEEIIIQKFNFKNSLIELGIEKAIGEDWLKVRKEKKAVNTQTAFEAIKNEIAKCHLSPNECIKLAVQRSWIGFKAEWVKNTQHQQTAQPQKQILHPSQDSRFAFGVPNHLFEEFKRDYPNHLSYAGV